MDSQLPVAPDEIVHQLEEVYPDTPYRLHDCEVHRALDAYLTWHEASLDMGFFIPKDWFVTQYAIPSKAIGLIQKFASHSLGNATFIRRYVDYGRVVNRLKTIWSLTRKVAVRRHAPQLWRVQKGHCGICWMPICRGDFHVDHIHPVSAFPEFVGADINGLSNLQLTHPNCNQTKADSVGRYLSRHEFERDEMYQYV